MKIIRRLSAFFLLMLIILPRSAALLENPLPEGGPILVALNVCDADAGILLDSGNPASVDMSTHDAGIQFCRYSYNSITVFRPADLVLSPKYPPPKLPLS